MNKFVSRFPLPNERQREILTILIEEAAEVQQRATKALRFGLEEVQPGQELTNAERLAREVGDFETMTEMALEEGLIHGDDVVAGRYGKDAGIRPARVPSWWGCCHG